MNKIVFQIEGPEQNNHHLDMSVFVEKTRQFLELLKSIAKDGNADGVVFHVVSLSHSSPATIGCEPQGQDALAAFNKVDKILNLIEEQQADHLSHPVLSSMENLARYKPQQIARAEVHTVAEEADKRVYELDDRFRETLSKARSAEEKVTSTIDGKLEQINIHGSANTFKIYSSLSYMPSVTCKFSDELLGNVQGALGRFVSVWGKCFYRPDAAFPYKIDVREMEMLPPCEELPSLSDLRGIAPEATGSKSSEQFVRESRDKWG